MYVIGAIIVCCLIALIGHIQKSRKFKNKLKHVYGPKPLPIIGNALDFMSPLTILQNLLKYVDQFGSIYKINLGPLYTYLVVSDPEMLEFILSSNQFIQKSHDYNHFKKWLGNGLITAPGQIWKKQRKILTPAFHFKILERIVETFPDSHNILVKKLLKECESGQKEVDIYPFVTLCALDVICESVMGISINAQEDAESEFVTATRQMLKIIASRIFSFYKQFDVLYDFTSDSREEKRALEILHQATHDVVKKRKLELSSKTKTKSEDIDEFGMRKKRSFLDTLLELEVDGQPISEQQIADEVSSIMFAGHDTTASSISFTLYCLSQHPEIQQKVVDEIHSIMGKETNQSPTYTDLQSMKYLEMVIKESLRIYPSVPFIGRAINEDVKYKDLTLPKGLVIMGLIYGVHKNPKIYPDPDKFNPERFTPDEISKRHPFSYIPFSAGQRNCIGQKYAMLSLKSTICKVLMNFELLPTNQKLILSQEVVLKSKNGVPIILKKR